MPSSLTPRSKALVTIAAVISLVLAICLPTHGQILYNTFTPNGEQLRQVNPDGTNNVPLQFGGLPQAANPVISPDGVRIAFRSSNPARPNQFSTNLFVANRVTGQIGPITQLQDATDLQGNTFNHTPRYSAFSPDGSLLVVTDFVNTATNAGTGSTVPFISLHDVPDGTLVGDTAMLTPTDALATIGVGISWSAASNLIATPLSAANATTAIFGSNSAAGIPVTQLTNPTRGNVGLSGLFVEHDSFPTYSPTGGALAYFRTTSRFTTSPFVQQLPSVATLRIIQPNGADNPVFNFAEGIYPTGISWSPDGTQLALGLGTQLADGGVFLETADLASSEIVLLDLNSGSIRQLVPAPAFSPAWSPLSLGLLGDFNGDGQLDASDINLLSGAVGSNNLQFDVTSDGAVTSADREFWVINLKGSLIGDADFNGEVMFDDFLTLSGNFGAPGGWAAGDFDGSGTVDFPDFLALSGNFGRVAGSTITAVPEPQSNSGVLLLGLVTFATAFRRGPRLRQA